MKFGPVTKIDKRNTATLKRFDDDFMSASCDFIVIFSVYGQYEVIQKPDSGRIISKTCIFSTLSSKLSLIVT